MIAKMILIFTCLGALQVNAQNGSTCFGFQDSLTNRMIYTYAEDEPEYPGGWPDLIAFFDSTMVTPQDAEIIHGIVYVRFIVEIDGSLSAIEIIRGINQEIDAEILRVLNLMPPWIPGSCDGEPVPIQFTLPIKVNVQ